KLGTLSVMNFQTIMWCARCLDWLQSFEATDAMVDVDHQIAGRETGGLGDEIFRSASDSTRANKPIAKNILLADDRRVFGLESCFEAGSGARDCGLGRRQALRPAPNWRKIFNSVIGEHMAHAIACAIAP